MSDKLNLEEMDTREQAQELEIAHLDHRDLDANLLEHRGPENHHPEHPPIGREAGSQARWQMPLVGVLQSKRLQSLSGWQGILLGLLIGGVVATMVGKLTSPKPGQVKAGSSPTASQTTSQAASQSVSLETVETRAIAQTVPAQGNVDARDWAAVIPQATGLQIQQILVEEGQQVEADQAIAQLDTSTLQDQLSDAQSQLNAARAQQASAEAKQTSAEAQVEAAQTQLTSAQANVAQKQALLGQQNALLAEAESNRKRYQELANQKVISQQDLEARTTSAVTAREGVSVAQSNINAAQADVGRARAGVSQAESGRSQAAAEVVQARAGVQSAIARLQQLQTKLAQATVRAPVSGTLTKKNPNSGQAVAQVGELASATPLFFILQAGALDLQVKVPESLLSQIKVGAIAQITSDADARIKLSGKVREIEPVVNEQKQAIVKISLPSSALLKPGMFLKAAIATQTSQALTIPDTALKLQSDGSKVVFILDQNNIAHAKSVEIGDPSNGRIPIKQGLKQGDRIIAQPGFVNDGDRIQVVNP